MKKKIFLLTFISLILTMISAIVYKYSGQDCWLSLAITFGTFSYHFVMRLLVGYSFQTFMKNKADYNRWWYRERSWEKSLYKTLKVRTWKSKMPTFEKSYFDSKIHTLDEIAGAMCQAELVHETIAVLSFLPIAAGVRFGAYPVFIITSVLSAILDLSFAVMQRYNRPRVVRLIKRQQQNNGYQPNKKAEPDQGLPD